MDSPDTRQVEIDPLILAICRQVKMVSNSPDVWDDPSTPRRIVMGRISGWYAVGWKAFVLSWFDDNRVRYDCEVTLEDVEGVLSGEITTIELKRAERSGPNPPEVILPIDQELMDLCSELNAMGRSHQEWEENEIEEGWKSENFIAGFLEGQDFLFSWFDKDGVEYFFNISYAELPKVVAGEFSKVRARRWIPETSECSASDTDLR